jgi:opacity protein-like surface antigen
MRPAVAPSVAILLASLALVVASPAAAAAQARTPPSIEGYAMFGATTFTAAESFKTILGEPSGPILGGGIRIGLGLGGLFFDVGAWRFQGDGERAFIYNDDVFPLGIPVEVTVTPLEISGGWRFRIRRLPKLIPYAAGGLTSLHYRETSQFAATAENVDRIFNGYHVLGGAEYKITRWLGLAGEASWTGVPDAIGEGGVSQRFSETDLGGTTLRVKITIGR